MNNLYLLDVAVPNGEFDSNNDQSIIFISIGLAIIIAVITLIIIKLVNKKKKM